MALVRTEHPRALSLLFLIPFAPAVGIAFSSAMERWIPGMKTNVFAADAIGSKPLLDREVPKRTATATFAMG
jgi:hypothetical protein